MRPRPDLVVLAVLTAATPPAGALATASAHPTTGTATYKCRTQTITFARSAAHTLNLSVGPKVRSDPNNTPTLTDNRVTATLALVSNDPPEKTRYLNIVSEFPSGQAITRLESVTLYPAKGATKHFKIVVDPNKDDVYTYDLLKDRGQVQLPVDGNDGDGRPTPKLDKVVVVAKENCFTTQ